MMNVTRQNEKLLYNNKWSDLTFSFGIFAGTIGVEVATTMETSNTAHTSIAAVHQRGDFLDPHLSLEALLLLSQPLSSISNC
jgi:hypothetical protein